jgi:hypothetical protein
MVDVALELEGRTVGSLHTEGQTLALFFGLTRTTANEVVEQVKSAVANWRRVADSAGAPRREIAELQDAFIA